MIKDDILLEEKNKTKENISKENIHKEKATQKSTSQEIAPKENEQKENTSQEIAPKKNAQKENTSHEIAPKENISQETSLKTTTSEFEPIQNPPTNKLHIFLIFLCILLTIILVSFVCFTLVNAHSNNIIAGVYVHRFEVSKLSKEGALATVNNRISANIPEEIKLTYKDFETSIPTADLNITFDSASAVDKAYTVGRKRQFITKRH